MPHDYSVQATFTAGLAIGFGVGFYLLHWLTGAKISHPARSKSGDGLVAFEKGDDDCFSLFYDHWGYISNDSSPREQGKGFPMRNSCRKEIETTMRTVHPEFRLVPKDLYSKIVEHIILVCVDVICLRKSDNKILLFFRRDKPASDTWFYYY